MKVESFVADTAAEALEQIKSRLGPDAMVLDVRKLPGEGLSRLFHKSRIEVLACAPGLDVTVGADEVVPVAPEPLPSFHSPPEPWMQPQPVAVPPETRLMEGTGWKIESLLNDMGFSPLNKEKVLIRLREVHGNQPPVVMAEEMKALHRVLTDWWRQRVSQRKNASAGIHVFIGPAGSGKSTALCKWLTKATLMEGRTARVWRLDGRTVNMAEMLSVYGEILGVRIERSGPVISDDSAEICFVDFPGVDWREAGAISELAQRLGELPLAEVHLVLNGAYEMPILLAQVRAFAAAPVSDLLITHLDEEPRWTKLWNLVLGTSCPIRYFSAGQNIPGDFFDATPELLLSGQPRTRPSS